MEIPKDWRLQDGHLVRSFTFADFVEAMAFVNRVAALAEAADHHPDILIQWNTVRLELWTHTADAVTGKDVDLAIQVNRQV